MPVSRALQWVVAAYSLTMGMFIMSAATLADRRGRRRAFIARHRPVLGRVRDLRGWRPTPVRPERRPRPAGRRRRHGQRGLAGPRERRLPGPEDARRVPSASGRASRRSASPSARPSAAFLTETVGWRSIFFVNVIVGGVAVVLVRAPSSRSRPTPPQRDLDLPGQLLFIVGVGALTYALIEGPHTGWLSPLIIGLLRVDGRASRSCSSWPSCAPPTR